MDTFSTKNEPTPTGDSSPSPLARGLTTSKSFGKNLFLSVGAVFVVFAVCFSIYQYNRERQFKIDILDARLRTYCYEMEESLGRDSLESPSMVEQYVATHRIEGLRVTIIDSIGSVLFDSSTPYAAMRDNHLGRKEIDEAFRTGTGYDIKRTSVETRQTYFYSATRFGNIVVRVAVPYSAELTRSLRADNAYLYFAITLTVLLGLVLYLSTSRVAKHISYLRDFALHAERGEQLDHELERSLPDDELGDICHTITSLYWKLRHSEEDKTRLKRQLTQNATHELKTPAASIQGYLESIVENPDMPDDKKQYFISRCYSQSERLCNLLADMSTLMRLDFSSSPQVGAVIQSEHIDIAELMRGILDEVAPVMADKGITPSLLLPAEITITGDRELLYSLFRNIIDNTLAYATGADHLAISCHENGESYEFTIADNGQGVDAVHLPHLFERFYRVDKGRSRKTGGTGLGLAIAKNVVVKHGGTIAAETTLGGGLTIRFTMKKS